jgi:uncharacterized repeat protein (TIGR01451 family)
MEDAAMRDAFWGLDPGVIRRTTLSGPAEGLVNVPYAFTASVSPFTAEQPVTYVWQVAGQAPLTQTGGLSTTAVLSWDTVGSKGITVTATNTRNRAVATHAVTIGAPVAPEKVTIRGPALGAPGLYYSFAASISPPTTTLPVTFTWRASGQEEATTRTGGLSDTMRFRWGTTGTQAITVTATNVAGTPISATQQVVVEAPRLAVRKSGPATARGGDRITYTIRLTNTGHLTLTATVTDFRPAAVRPSGDLTWPPVTLGPADSWSDTLVVTIELGYVGVLTNRVGVTTREGAAGEAGVVTCVGLCIYLPFVFR